MTVTPADIGWSTYGNYEGPFFIGRQPYVLPDVPTENDKVMKVITAAEGGHYDAINMYDSGIVSVGLIQWINAGQHSVDNMLGQVAEECGIDKVTGPLADALAASGATFKKNVIGAWRFFDAVGEVASNDAERRLFMKGCGPKGSWSADAIAHAKLWAACLANIWADAGARQAQVNYTVPRLKSFLAPDVQRSLYDDKPSEGWVGAVRAALIHYAVNLPAYVARAYRSYHSTAAKWSPDWSIGLIKQVTATGPASLWSARYNAIRPVLEALYGISLPKTASALMAWQPTMMNVSSNLVVPPSPQLPPLPAPQEPHGCTSFDTNVPVASVPSLPGEKPADKLIRLVRSHVGCSLSTRRDELGKLVSRGVDKPEAVVAVAANSATVALGIMAEAGVKHKLLNQPYVSGMATAWIRQIGRELGALVKFDGKTMPPRGALLLYCAAGTNNDHVEWLLGPIDSSGIAEHAGGGRADNAIASCVDNVLSNCGRPLVEWLDPDKLGIDFVPKEEHTLPPTPEPENVSHSNPQPMPEPHVTPAPPPSPIVPADQTVPIWRAILNFFVMIFFIIFKRGGK